MRRHASREWALKMLYAWELSGSDPLESIQYMAGEDEFCLPAPDDFSLKILQGVLDCRAQIDEMIDKNALDWDFQRISIVDRNILRIAIYEILFLKDAPFAAVVNEAVEIAKIYGSEDSFRFVNGILGRMKPGAEEASDARTGVF